MNFFNFLRSNNKNHKSIRVKTNIGDKYINVKLDQTYESLDILSLKIFQKDIYRLFDADYGVIVGRVLGTGVGIPNCRISVFVPIDENEEIVPTNLDDIKKIEALALYPYQTVYDKDSSGKIYNLLPKYAKNRNVNGFPDNEYGIGATPVTPVGTFPEKEEILVNETVAYVYDKYLRYTTVTNESGDYILTVPSNRSYTITMCCDITDIGKFSTTAALLKLEGYTDNYFNETGTLINEDIPLERLPNIDIQNLPIYVNPLWSQNQENTNVGINRLDFNISKKIRPFSTVIGNYFTQNKKSWWGDRIAFRVVMGLRNLCVPLVGGCQATNTSTWFSVYFKFYLKLCLGWVGDYDVFNISYNTAGGSGCGFSMCFGFEIKYILPYFNMAFNENKYCTLNGGKVKYEPWDIRFVLADTCSRNDALGKLGGDITDSLFIQTHETGTIDIKVMTIKNSIPDTICDTLNNLPLDNTTLSTTYDFDKEIELLQSNKYIKYIKDGSFVVILSPNRKKVITNEEGDLIEVDSDSDVGVFTQFRGYFYITHLDSPDNPATQNRTGKIALKIPQYFDYNQNGTNWIWKHFIFDAGEIYSVAQLNEVKNSNFSTDDEFGEDDMLVVDKAKGFDEQTNILYTGFFEEDNKDNTTYKRNVNEYLTYKSFYNHIVTLGFDGDIQLLGNGKLPISETGDSVPSPPQNQPIAIRLFKYGTTDYYPASSKSGWNMFNNNPANGLESLKIRIALLFQAGSTVVNLPSDKDIWSFGIKAENQNQIQFMRNNNTPFYGENQNYLFNIDNLTPIDEFVSNTDGVIFKIFEFEFWNIYYFYTFTNLMVTYGQSDYQPLIIETVLSNGYDNSSYYAQKMGITNRSASNIYYIDKPYN
jgi:hypothetical protein